MYLSIWGHVSQLDLIVYDFVFILSKLSFYCDSIYLIDVDALNSLISDQDQQPLKRWHLVPASTLTCHQAMSSGHKMSMGLWHLFAGMEVPHIAEPTPQTRSSHLGQVWIILEPGTCDNAHNIKQCGFWDSAKHQEVAPVHIPGALNHADLFAKERRDGKHFLQLRAALMTPRQLQSTRWRQC